MRGWSLKRSSMDSNRGYSGGRKTVKNERKKKPTRARSASNGAGENCSGCGREQSSHRGEEWVKLVKIPAHINRADEIQVSQSPCRELGKLVLPNLGVHKARRVNSLWSVVPRDPLFRDCKPAASSSGQIVAFVVVTLPNMSFMTRLRLKNDYAL